MRTSRLIGTLMVMFLLSLALVYSEAAAPLGAGFVDTTPPTMFQGTVVALADGDTLTVLVDRSPHKIRLSGIDCPERKQNYGTVARQALADLVFQKEVTVVAPTKDRYGRWVGLVILKDGRVVNYLQVQQGYCWVYRKYTNDSVLISLENIARDAKSGLWQDPIPIPPWDWRSSRKKTG